MNDYYGWVADFETSKNEEETETWVWLWAACSIHNPDTVILGNSIDSFMDWASVKKKIYFHNLKYDGGFITDYLLKNNYTHRTTGKLGHKQFDTLISNANVWYKLRFCNTGTIVNIFDSWKKLPFSVEKIGKNFMLDVVKGSIDHSIIRYPGHEASEEEIKYVTNDVQIIAKALKIQFKQGLSKITIGSDALTWFKKQMGDHYRYYFPQITLPQDGFMRKAYRGGYTYLKEAKDYGESVYLDVNSLYPYAMTQPLPYGSPVYFKGQYPENSTYPLYIQTFVADFTLKNDRLPTVTGKNLRWFLDTDYITDSEGMQILSMTNVDFDLFKKHYHIHEIQFKEGFMFRACTHIFIDYISYWMNVKENSEGAIRELAKLMLNNLYGKFATNPEKSSNKPVLFEDRVRYVSAETKISAPVYLPVGVFTTANARNVTITTAQRHYDRFIYSDTDCIFLTGRDIPDDIEVHPTKLGAWKHEYTSHHSRHLRAKRYFTHPYDDDTFTTYSTKLVCAGMPKGCKENVTFDSFKTGEVFDGKLQQKTVNGGVILSETTFTLL